MVLAPNKLIARLISKRPGLPNSQTMLLPGALASLLAVVPPRRFRLYEGDRTPLGYTIWYQNLAELADTSKVPHAQLLDEVGAKKSLLLMQWARGRDPTPVVRRGPPKSLLVERSFPKGTLPTSAIAPGQVVYVAVSELAKALWTRIKADYTEHARVCGTLVVHWRLGYSNLQSARTRTPPAVANAILTTDADASVEKQRTAIATMISAALQLIPKQNTRGTDDTLTRIALSATSFAPAATSGRSIASYFANAQPNKVGISYKMDS